MKKLIAITFGALLALSTRAQWVVYDPTMHVQQILDQAQSMARYIQMINNEAQQIRQMQQYNIAFGDPASLVNIAGANELIGDLRQSEIGQPLEALQRSSQGISAMTFDGNGIYHDIGQTFQTPSAIEVRRQPAIYRENAALERATENYTTVYQVSTQRRLALKSNIAATTEKLQNASTASEVQKLTGVLIAQNADLADTDRQIDHAADMALIQEAENRDDRDKQAKASL
ncbi:MAG: hypothetical protein KGR98_06905, partial [Verrucomicrobia bacterium]|nr:hypothetical protein [Verrucomicrobiota bacterium]